MSSNEDKLQEEFKKEIKKLEHGMLQLIEQLKNVEKVIEVDKMENIEVGTKSKKLKEPQRKDKKEILKWIK